MSDKKQKLFDTLGVGEEQMASRSDFEVSRDSNGEVNPVSTTVIGLDEDIAHFPMKRGDVDEYMPSDLAPQSLSPQGKADIINMFLLWPFVNEEKCADKLYDYEKLKNLTKDELREMPESEKITPEDIEDNFKAFTDADVIIKAILDGSGYEVLEAQGAKMMEKFEGNLNFEDLAGQMENGAASTPE